MRTAGDLTKMIRAREQQYAPWREALKARRGLMDVNLAAGVDEARLGTALPAPFNKSPLRMKIITGNAAQAVTTLAAAVSTNFPRVKVYPVSIHHEKIGKGIKKQSAEQERLLMYLAEELKAKDKQHQVSRSSVWGTVGWYFTLPKPAALGLPPRTYFDDYSAAEREDAKKRGIEMEEVYDGDKVRYAEPAASWIERRKNAARENWARASEMVMLEAYPPDMVTPWFALDGTVLRASITMEIPTDDLKPGSEFAKSAARHAKKHDGYEGDEDKYGLWLDGKDVKGGLVAGQEPGTGKTGSWNLTIFADREEVYYLCGPAGSDGGGKIVFYDEHNGGICPIIPAPFNRNDSRQPGSEFVTALDPIFRLAPAYNALWNEMVAGAGWNASVRYVETGVGQGNPETGEQTPGATIPGTNDPNVRDVYEGDLTQILVRLEDVIAVIDRAIAEMDKLMPSSLLTGDAVGGGDTAWGLQIQVGQIQQLYKQPVDNHAEAWRLIFTLWVRWMKQLGLPVIAFPSSKRGEGLIEIDPESLTEAFTVTQDSADAQMQTIRQQMGIERAEGGYIDDETLFEEFFNSDDPHGDVLKARLQKLKNLILFGDTSKIQPGSMLYVLAERVQGRLEQMAAEKAPNAAVAQAEAMLAESKQQAMAEQQAMIESQMPQTAAPPMPGMPGVGGQPMTLQDQLGDAAPVAAPMV